MWSAATDPAGINYEMRPLVRMTMPRALRGASVGDLTLGVPAGRCWLLLFGLLPVDYDDLCIVELEPPRRFLERSRMASMSLWEHERVIEPLAGGGSSVTDRLRFQLRSPLARVPGADRLAAAIVAGFFAHRHRRLRRRDRAAPSAA